jgi:hypothetical protein
MPQPILRAPMTGPPVPVTNPHEDCLILDQRPRGWVCDRDNLCRQRNCIERVLGHLKTNRAIATRYDQLAESFLGMLFIASARYWIKFVRAAKVMIATSSNLAASLC